jgi:uncharacterized alpha-E superfamily protein
MLSRHAENLYWIGRYVERAEDTGRLLDVTYHTVLEAGSGRLPSEMWAELLETLFLEDEIEVSGEGDGIGELLLADREHAGSVASLIARARENARITREWISAEVWETLNDIHQFLLRTDLVEAARNRPYEVLRTVKASCQAVNGSIDAAMPRGEGYRFFLMGQRIERALLTARVISVWHRRLGGVNAQAAFAEWVKILKSVSAYESYLRAHRASMAGDRVLAYLLQSRDFPRSVLHCLSQVEALLGDLAGGDTGASARRVAGRIRSLVEFSDPAALDLASFLQSVESGIVELGSEVERAYFRPAGSVVMHSYEAF